MSSIEAGELPSFKVPVCPTCDRPMSLEGVTSDRTHSDLSHMIYVCDCGRRSDQLVADQNSRAPEIVLGGNVVAPTRRKMVESAEDFAIYCYAAAELCPPGKHRDYFLLRAQKWEKVRSNLERDTKAIAESRALLAKLQTSGHEPVLLKIARD
jgi:hypothetical protein